MNTFTPETLKTRATNKNTIYSFDIFDTLITRSVANPFGIFHLMQYEINSNPIYNNCPSFVKKNFAVLRDIAERMYRSDKYIKLKKDEVTLDEIYKNFENLYLHDKNLIDLIKQLEIDIEFNNMVPINKNIQYIEKLVKDGYSVVLISDMYHSAKTIRSFLLKFNDIFKNIAIYTSCEYQLTKSSGKFYKFLKAQPDFEGKYWIHCGDNSYSDIKMAKLENIDAQHYMYSGLIQIEKNMLSKYDASAALHLLIGTAKNLRINNEENDVYKFAATYACPVLYQYVYWLIEESQKKNIKRLYFIARDGYILKLVADSIIEQLGIDIKTHYIYGSRIAWRVISEQNYSTIVNKFFDLEQTNIGLLDVVHKTFGIDAEKLGYKKDYKHNKILNAKEIQDLKNKILNDKAIVELVIANNKEKHDKLEKYLLQEVNCENNDFAFVDAVGSGLTMEYIYPIFYKETGAPLNVFYAIAVNPTVSLNKNINVNYYAYSQNINPAFFEVFCNTVEGQTIGYEEKESYIVPIKEQPNNLGNWGYESYVRGIKDYSKTLSHFLKINKVKIENVQMFLDYMCSVYDSKDSLFLNVLQLIPYNLQKKDKKE